MYTLIIFISFMATFTTTVEIELRSVPGFETHKLCQSAASIFQQATSSTEDLRKYTVITACVKTTLTQDERFKQPRR